MRVPVPILETHSGTVSVEVALFGLVDGPAIVEDGLGAEVTGLGGQHSR